MQRLANIEYIDNSNQVRNPADDHDIGILIHGYGADAYDLASLGDVLKGGRPIRWVCPQGITEVPIGPGWTGRAWWPLAMSEIQKASERGEHLDFADIVPPTLPDVRARLFKFIDGLKTPWNKIILAGFSQGGMLAVDLFLNAPETPKGLIVFSSNLINKTAWKEKVPARAGSRFFMAHGTGDQVLSHAGSQRLESLLVGGGMKGKLFSFRGSHEIPMDAILQANQYLSSL
jgi:phospholipase/carboxylesterase